MFCQVCGGIKSLHLDAQTQSQLRGVCTLSIFMPYLCFMLCSTTEYEKHIQAPLASSHCPRSNDP